MKRIAIFPGSFDPFTKGHEDIVIRSLQLFDEVIIGIGNNPGKKRFFELDMLIPKIESVFVKYPQVKVLAYEGLTADLAKKTGAKFLIRGLRNSLDLEYETGIAQANKHVYHELETVFLITTPSYSAISSSIIRELYKFGQNVDTLLPYKI